MKTNTKAAREAVRQYEHNNLTSKGYEVTTGENVVIYTHSQELILKAFAGTSAKPYQYTRYRSVERMSEAVKGLIDQAERITEYKKAQKARNNGKPSSHAATAAAIRQELKQAFPGIQFSVKADSFANGNAVRISWTNGPTQAEVNDVAKKYQYGSFNGMEDMYEYTNTRENLPQVKYITTDRHIEDSVFEVVFESLKSRFVEGTDEHQLRRDAWQILRATTIPFGAKIVGIKRAGDCEVIDSCYTLDFDLSAVEETSTAPNIAPVEVNAGKVQVVEYGVKAIAVIGDTKPIKDKLKDLGGRFNFRLSCGAGWIFPKSKLTELQNALTNV